MIEKNNIVGDITEIKVTVKEIAVNQRQLSESIKNHSKTLYGM